MKPEGPLDYERACCGVLCNTLERKKGLIISFTHGGNKRRLEIDIEIAYRHRRDTTYSQLLFTPSQMVSNMYDSAFPTGKAPLISSPTLTSPRYTSGHPNVKYFALLSN
ncbi:hypothetical protein V1478_018841, partial [Vespula squamosa]